VRRRERIMAAYRAEQASGGIIEVEQAVTENPNVKQSFRKRN
jgi:hypothetical protein